MRFKGKSTFKSKYRKGKPYVATTRKTFRTRRAALHAIRRFNRSVPTSERKYLSIRLSTVKA